MKGQSSNQNLDTQWDEVMGDEVCLVSHGVFPPPMGMDDDDDVEF